MLSADTSLAPHAVGAWSAAAHCEPAGQSVQDAALPSEYEPTSNLSAAYIATHGATLEEWSTYLQCFAPVQVETTYAGEATAAAFRIAVNAYSALLRVCCL